MNDKDRIVKKLVYRYSIEEKLQILQAYADENEEIISDIQLEEVYTYRGVDYNVGLWIDFFRKSYKATDGRHKPLTQDVVDRLNDMGMIWVKKTCSFEEKIKILKAYVADENNEYNDISQIEALEKYEYNGNTYCVGSWIRHFRRAYNGDKYHEPLTNEQIKILTELGMNWEPFYTKFEMKIEVLKAYIAEYSDIARIKRLETYEYKGKTYPVGIWIQNFRRLKKEGTLSKYRINALDALEMVWVKGYESAYSFEKKIEVLKAYHKDIARGCGTIAFIRSKETFTYQTETYEIGAWIKALRKSYKGYGGYKKLTPEQVSALESLGMVWEVKNMKKARAEHKRKIEEELRK